MKRPQDIDLMQHADDELDGLIDLDGESRAKVEALHHLREAVRGSVELAADDVPDAKFARMWGEIEKVLENEKAPVAVEKIPEPDRPSIVRRIGRWFDRHIGHIVTGVVSAGAVAAIALIMHPGTDDVSATHKGGLDVQPVNLRTPTEIESMDTPDGTGMVLNLEDQDGHTTVIWVTPADTVEGI